MPIGYKKLSQLKEALQQGDISETLSLLNTLSDVQDLVKIREQKLLLKVRDLGVQVQLVDAYKHAVNRSSLSEVEKEKACLYADFTNLAVNVFQKITADMDQLIKPIYSISPIELLNLITEVADENYDSIYHAHITELDLETRDLQAPEAEQSDISEHSLHEFNGKINDALFAMARVINVIYPYTKKSKAWSSSRKIHLNVKQHLFILTQMASNWNSLELAIDMLTYGEWYVENLQHDPPKAVFGVYDTPLLRARMIGIRRGLVAKYYYRNKKERYVKEILEGFAVSVTEDAIKYLQRRHGYIVLSQRNQRNLHEGAQTYLRMLDTEDDLLLAASGANNDISILIHYASGLAIRCFSSAALLYRECVSKKKAKALACPELPLDIIITLILEKLFEAPGNELHKKVADSVNLQITSLPTSFFFDIIHRPHIRISDNYVVCLKSFEDVNWTTSLRTQLVQGDRLSKSYGSIVEKYISMTLENYGWAILGCGINVKRTDIDVLAFRNGLLLVIQVKAIARGGFDIYENWKSREAIIKGASQAAIAEEELRKRPDLISSLLSSKKVKQNVNLIQPIVITTSPLFSGWICNGIPVFGIGSLMSLLKGARVEYKDRNQLTVKIQKFSSNDELTPEEFVRFLQEPMEWKIARESNEIDHIQVNLAHIQLLFPKLKRDISLQITE